MATLERMPQEEMRKHNRNAWASASAEHHTQGEAWYARARDIARGLAQKYPAYPLHTTSLVLAALSPRVSWERNIAYADKLLRDGESATIPVLGRSKANAVAAMGGAESVNGPKTSAFAHLIEYPDDANGVCVDTHAINIALGYVASEKEVKHYAARVGNSYIAQCYVDVAADLNVLPSTVQAVTWCYWRDAITGATARHGDSFQ